MTDTIMAVIAIIGILGYICVVYGTLAERKPVFLIGLSMIALFFVLMLVAKWQGIDLGIYDYEV